MGRFRFIGDMWFDSHVHFDRFLERDELSLLLETTAVAGVHEMLAVGGSVEANERSRMLAAAHGERIVASAGFDRDVADEVYDAAALEAQVAEPLVRAVGETGLDYFHGDGNRAAQQALFELNLSLAARYEKPVIVHSRAADEDTVAMLGAYVRERSERPGVLHCFTLDRACAGQLLDLGFMISFSGIVTFANAEALREVVPYVPDDRLLVETDAPYLAPVPERGKENTPAFVGHTGARLAALRGCSVEHVAALTRANARRLFGWNEERC